VNTTAIGRAAYAGFGNSTAIGAGAVSTKGNQVRLGATGTSVSIADIGFSDSQQSGQEFFLTIDNSGTVGKGAQSSAALAAQSSMISELQTQQALIDDTVATHTTQIGQLFNLADLNRREARRGIAAAAAIASAPFPSAPGKTSYTANSAIYRGEVAFSASMSHRLDTGSPFALTAAVSHSGGKDTVARVGVAGEF
jgi:trimeric autotransporter adhesin